MGRAAIGWSTDWCRWCRCGGRRGWARDGLADRAGRSDSALDRARTARCLLLIGGVRRTHGSPEALAVQLAGLTAYVALALAALATAPEVTVLLVGPSGGWRTARGDVVHHRLNRVVPRWYAQCCAVVDVIVGISVLSAL